MDQHEMEHDQGEDQRDDLRKPAEHDTTHPALLYPRSSHISDQLSPMKSAEVEWLRTSLRTIVTGSRSTIGNSGASLLARRSKSFASAIRFGSSVSTVILPTISSSFGFEYPLAFPNAPPLPLPDVV